MELKEKEIPISYSRNENADSMGVARPFYVVTTVLGEVTIISERARTLLRLAKVGKVFEWQSSNIGEFLNLPKQGCDGRK